MKKIFCIFICSIVLFGNLVSSAMFCKVGYRGENVKMVQRTLAAKGYGVGKHGVDGMFGRDTEFAVKRFQRDHKLSVDGMVGPATQKVLFGSSKKTDYNSISDIKRVLKFGCKGDDVKFLQKTLIAKGYSVGVHGVDGSYGPATVNAVKNFQKTHGLSADGMLGPVTKAALSPHKLPDKGKPNSVGEQRDSKGTLKRRRFYGPDGRAVKDEDYSDHGNPAVHPNPHDHSWDWTKAPKDRRSKDPQPHNPWTVAPITQETAKKAAVAAAGGYVLYRGIRMLPSLIPSLWWTIPENIIIP